MNEDKEENASNVLVSLVASLGTSSKGKDRPPRNRFKESIENLLRSSDARLQKNAKSERDPGLPPRRSKTNLLPRFEMADEKEDNAANHPDMSASNSVADQSEASGTTSRTDVNSQKNLLNIGVPLSKQPRLEMGKTGSPSENSDLTPRRNERIYGTAGSLRSTPSNMLDEDLTSERSFGSSRAYTPRKRLNSILGGNVSPELRSYIIEKEVVESQHRKLQVEVTSLQTENKLLKEKYNRATAQIVNLERQLADAQHRVEQTEDDLSAEMSSIRKKSRTEADSEKQDLLKQIANLTKENEILTAENSSLEKQLDAARRTSDIVRQASDKSKIVAAYKAESASLREELSKVKSLLSQSDKQRRDDEERRKESLQQIAKLTEMNNLLKQQLELGGSALVAEKQVKSLDVRLKVTEERLQQERADRSVKLSEVEDKLLKENAKFQVAAKEAKRQLHREKEKVKHLEQKLSSLKDQLKQYGSGDEYGSPLRTSPSKKDESIPYYDQSPEVEHQKDLSVEKKLYEDKFKRLTEELDDKTKEMQELEMTLKLQINSLVKEKHETITKVRHLEDQVAGLQAENTSLKTGLDSGVSMAANADSVGSVHYEVQIETLKGEIKILEGKIAQQQRNIKLLEAEKETIVTQLDTKEHSLEEALRELENYGVQQEHGESERKQQKIDRLTAENHSIQSELREWQMKHRHITAEKQQMQDQMDKLKKELTRLKQNWENQTAEHAESFKLELQSEIHEKEMQILSLKSQFMQNEDELQMTRQELILEQENLIHLKKEVENLQSLLHQEKEQNKLLHNQESDLQAEIEALKDNLKWSNKELNEKSREVVTEMETLKHLLESKEARIEKLSATISHQKQDLDSLNRQIERLKEESASKTEEIEKLTFGMEQKALEMSSATEVSQYLTNERTKIQMEKYEVEKKLAKQIEMLEEKRLEIGELTRKLETEEDRHSMTEEMLKEKENHIVSLDTDMHRLRKKVSQLEEETRKLQEESKKWNTISSGLEKRLTAAKLEVAEAKSASNQLGQEYGMASKQLDLVKQEYEVAVVTLETEKSAAGKLKEKIRADENKISRLEEELRVSHERVDRLNGQLSASQDMVEQLKGDKQSLYSDLQELCHKLSEKDELIGQLQEKCSETVETVHNEYAMEKVKISRQKESVEEELKRTKMELKESKEQLKQKDIQMNTYGRTLLDLEGETKARQQLENRATAMEMEVLELKQLNSALKAEKVSLTESNRHLQDTSENAKAKIARLKETISEMQEKHQKQTENLRQSMADRNIKQETEMLERNEKYIKTNATVKTLEVSLTAANETKELYLHNNRQLEKTIDSLKTQLHEEITLRKLSEQKIDTYKTQLEEVKKRKVTDDQITIDLQQKLNETERAFNIEHEKLQKCREDLSNMETTAHAHESKAQSLLDQFNILQADYSTLRQQYDSLKYSLSGKHKKTTLELKQQLDHFMSEKNKLSLQVQNLTADLEQARDLVAVKNKENLKMHEEHLSLQEKLSEAKSQLRELHDQVQVEADLRKKLDKRNNDLEDDLMKLQLVVGKLDQDGEDTKDSKTDDNIKAEIIRMLQELSLQLHLQQENRSHNSDNAKEMQLLEMYKNKIDGFEMELSSERAMHSLTKTQLRSLEEDNQRLRIQMAQIKKMRNSTIDKSNKTHLEEINDIIARSQTRAKALLPTGEFNLSMTGRDGDNGAMAGTFQGFDYSLKMNEFDRIRSPLNSGVMVETSPGNIYE